MGCGASSAAGDRAIVAATKIDPATEGAPSVKTLETERAPADSTSTFDGNEPQDASTKEKDSSKSPDLPKLSSTLDSAEPANGLSAELEVKSEDKKIEHGEETRKSAAKESDQRSPESRDGKDEAQEPGSAPDGAQAASEGVSTPTGDPLLTKRQSQSKLPPLKSPLAAVDSSKDPFAKPVLPTSVPLQSVAPVASSPTGSVTAAADSPVPKKPSSLPSTPKPEPDSPAPGTPVSARAAESKSPGPSKLGQGNSGSSAGTDTLVASAEAEPAHTPRTATETALAELMDDVSAVHV